MHRSEGAGVAGAGGYGPDDRWQVEGGGDADRLIVSKGADAAVGPPIVLEIASSISSRNGHLFGPWHHMLSKRPCCGKPTRRPDPAM